MADLRRWTIGSFLAVGRAYDRRLFQACFGGERPGQVDVERGPDVAALLASRPGEVMSFEGEIQGFQQDHADTLVSAMLSEGRQRQVPYMRPARRTLSDIRKENGMTMMKNDPGVQWLSERMPRSPLSDLEDMARQCREAQAGLREMWGAEREEHVVQFTPGDLPGLLPWFVECFGYEAQVRYFTRSVQSAGDDGALDPGEVLYGDGAYSDVFLTGQTRSGQKVGRYLGQVEPSHTGDFLADRWTVLQSMPAMWRYLTEGPVRVAFTCELHHFMKLGHHRCDTGSCFHIGKEYQDAPIVLAASPNTFVGYVKAYDPENIVNEGMSDERDRNPILGRFWGQISGGHVAITNIYPNRDLKHIGAISLWATAALEAMGFEGPWAKVHTCSGDVDGTGVYLNGWQVVNKPGEMEFRFADGLGLYDGEQCDDCGNRGDELIRTEAGSYVCETCSWENYVTIDGRDYLVSQGDTVMTQGGDLLHEDDAVPLYDGEWAPGDETVQLHNGEYAHEDDPDLRESYDGVHFIVA